MTHRPAKILRTVCLLISLTLVFAIFAGCEQYAEEISSAATSSERPLVRFPDDGGGYHTETKPNLLGYKMSFAVSDVSLIIPEEGESVEGDLKLEQFRGVQSELSCEITVKFVDDWDEVLAAVIAGEEYAQVIMPPMSQAGGFIGAGVCTDLSEYLPLGQAEWYREAKNALTFGSKTYATISSFSSPMLRTSIVLFNAEMLKRDLGMMPERLYELWENNTWTWDVLAGYSKTAVEKNFGGKADSLEDKWGFVYDSGALTPLIYSAGLAFVDTEGEKPAFGLNNEQAVIALKKLNQLFAKDGLGCPERLLNEETTAKRLFVDGKALFYLTTLNSITTTEIRDMDQDWGLLPTPLGPAQDGARRNKYVSNIGGDVELCMIPTTVNDKKSTAIVLEELNSDVWMVSNKEIETIVTLYARDDKSVEIADSLNSGVITLDTSLLFGGKDSSKNKWESSVGAFLKKLETEPGLDVGKEAKNCAAAAKKIIDGLFSKK